VLGCELVAAVRALRMDPDRLPGSPLRAVYDAAAAVLHEDRADRPLSDDLAAAVRLVEGGLAG
jgi:histidine ammonia-lyase